MIYVSPSILSADFANLERDIKRIEDGGADWVHVDVMDGHFVPNITIGVPVVASIRKVTKLPLDVHLMIENPEKYVEPFVKAGADILTFHYECGTDIKKTIDLIITSFEIFSSMGSGLLYFEISGRAGRLSSASSVLVSFINLDEL